MTNKSTFEEINRDPDENGSPERAQASEDSLAENDSSLKALIAQESAVARQNLKATLGREPSQEEVDEWLRAHTESY